MHESKINNNKSINCVVYIIDYDAKTKFQSNPREF